MTKIALFVSNCMAWRGSTTAIFSAAWSKMLDRYGSVLPCDVSFVHIVPDGNREFILSAGSHLAIASAGENLPLFVDAQRALWKTVEESMSAGYTHWGFFHADSFPSHECLTKICQRLETDPKIDIMYPFNQRAGYLVNGVVFALGATIVPPWNTPPPGASSTILNLDFLRRSITRYQNHPRTSLRSGRSRNESYFETRYLSYGQCCEYLQVAPDNRMDLNGDVLVHGCIGTDLWTVMVGLKPNICVITDTNGESLLAKHAGMFALGTSADVAFAGWKDFEGMRSPGPTVPSSIYSVVEAPYFHLADSPSIDMLMQPEVYQDTEKTLFLLVSKFGSSPNWIAYSAISRLLARSFSLEAGLKLDLGIKHLLQLTKSPIDWPKEMASGFEEKVMRLITPAIRDYLIADTMEGVISDKDRLTVWGL